MFVCEGHPGWQAELSLRWECRCKPQTAAGGGEGEDEAALGVGPVSGQSRDQGLVFPVLFFSSFCDSM